MSAVAAAPSEPWISKRGLKDAPRPPSLCPYTSAESQKEDWKNGRERHNPHRGEAPRESQKEDWKCRNLFTPSTATRQLAWISKRGLKEHLCTAHATCPNMENRISKRGLKDAKPKPNRPNTNNVESQKEDWKKTLSASPRGSAPWRTSWISKRGLKVSAICIPYPYLGFWFRNLKKRIESHKPLFSVCLYVEGHESQKEDWKTTARTPAVPMGWKKGISKRGLKASCQ